MSAPASSAAIAAVAAAAVEPEAEQLDMLPPTRFEPGTDEHARLSERIARDRAGRPPGARNLATRQAVAFIRRVFGDPLVERARWLRHTPETLAAELGCTKLEAFDRLDKIAGDLALFVYPKLAPVDGDGHAVAPVFHMTLGGREAGADGRVPWDYEGGPTIEETAQNQPVSAPVPPVSYGSASYGEPK